jgi:hypothetical protein
MLPCANQLRDTLELRGTNNDIDVGSTPRDFGACALCHTACDTDDHVWALGFEFGDTSKF